MIEGLWLAYLFQEEYQEYSDFVFKYGIWLILQAFKTAITLRLLLL